MVELPANWLQHYPQVQGVQFRRAVLLASLKQLGCRFVLDGPLDLLGPDELLQGEHSDLALGDRVPGFWHMATSSALTSSA